MMLLDLISSFQGPRTTLLHTEPQDELEETLLYKAVNAVGRRMEPAIFPLAKMNVSVFICHAFLI
jgi:hypothetical protein